MKKGDLIIYICAGVLALLPLLALLAPAAEPARAVVRIDGKTVRAFPLDRDAQEEFATENGTNTVVVANGSVSVTHADCPDKTCVSMGGISRVNETLVCLPHHLTVTIEGETTSAPDAVSQ